MQACVIAIHSLESPLVIIIHVYCMISDPACMRAWVFIVIATYS